MSTVYSSKAPIDVACMAMAHFWAQLRSKDPNTKVGSCIYHPKSGAMFLGYNGFPAGIPDSKSLWDQRDRSKTPCKYDVVVHSEVAAVQKALRTLNDLSDCVLYVTHFPCRNCMKDVIISSGIRHVVFMSAYPPDAVSEELARAAGVELVKSHTDFAFKDQSPSSWTNTAKTITIT